MSEERFIERRDNRMAFKRAGVLTKIVILALLVYLSVTLIGLRGQIRDNESQLNLLTEQVAQQTQANQKLSDAIENSDDPATIIQAARDKGYVLEGEQIMIDVSN